MEEIMKCLLLLMCLFLGGPSIDNGIIEDTSSYIEINHIYRYDAGDEVYKKRMVQLIWWEWRNYLFVAETDELGRETGSLERSSGFVVKDFRVIWSESSRPQQSMAIMPRRYKDKWICFFYDKNDRVFRRVTSDWMRETHTQNDPEIDDRKVFRIEDRNKLRKL
jgi:hypothetical protein